ncbi:hypothetical protein DH2020_000773 [Rehmannia glutinosa]|uniref:Calcium uniporter protein C-terminal domain-containing protein n=1 Tax=Rehmannia glutinosa TaxID=99300 RepID=A0ABR0XXJ6_REHGL
MWRSPGINLLKRAIKPVSSLGPNNRMMGPSFHHYCSSAAITNKANSMSYAEAKRLMRLVNVEALKDKLGTEDKEVIPYDDLLKTCQTVGVAKSTDEAARSPEFSMTPASFALRDKVYLHPDKVVDLVRRAVPLALLPEDDPRRGELKKLQQKKEEIDILAHKQVRRILWAGLGLDLYRSDSFSTNILGVFLGRDGADRVFHDHSWDSHRLCLLYVHFKRPELPRSA